jgi:superfamily II DNA or RNA helicase
LEHVGSRCLYIVPSVDLANQPAEKFTLYESYLKKHNKKWTYGILKSGLRKAEKDAVDNCDILFGTFQSLSNRPPEFFDGFKTLIGDEAHHISAVSIRDIISKCHNLQYKIAVTGTYQKAGTIDNLNMKSYYGPHVYTLSSDSLIHKEKAATPIYIVFQILNWADEDEKKMLWNARNVKSLGTGNIDYNVGAKLLRQEQKYVNASNKRLKYIADMAIKMSNNTLLLFGDIKGGYGKRIYDYLKDYSNKQVYYIDGSTSPEDREYYKKQCNDDLDGQTILVASIGTFGEGIDIANIGSIFLVNSAKSERIIRQICGRGLRLCPGKDKTVLYDFVDDLRYTETGKYNDNYMWTHYKERKKVYKEQNFPCFEQTFNI